MERLYRRVAAFAPWVFASVALQWGLWRWEVEDSAISFAYARNLIMGDGLVGQPGAERVEGFSNPLWVALLAAGQGVGIDPFVLSRWLGLLLGTGTVFAVYAAVRPVGKQLPLAPIAAAAVVSLYAPHAIWAQSGLENALFSFLLAAGCARIAAGARDDVLGPLLFLLLALTRPEGIAYALIAALAVIASSSSAPEVGVRVASWSIVLGVPMLTIEICRLWYFGQLLPATFYAKLGNQHVDPLDAASRGWQQLVSFSAQTGSVLLVPFAMIGASGASDWRWLTGPLSVVLLTFAWWYGPVVPGLLLLVSLPVLAFGRKLPVGLASSQLLVAVAFHLGTGGDWMVGYRWMSFAAVPFAMLVGVGIAEVIERFDPIWIGKMRIPALLPVGIIGGGFMVPQVFYALDYVHAPETSPQSVQIRLDHFLSVARRLQLDRRPRIVDHDMGGMLWYGGSLAQIRDARGLVDLPFALFGNEPSVVEHELFGDHPFDFAHAHAATGAALRRNPEFLRRYIEIEPYGKGQNLHGGQFIARALLLEERADTPAAIRFGEAATITGVEIPSPEIAPGSGLYLEVGLTRGDGTPVRLLGFLADETRIYASWELPPAYDWLPRSKWRNNEVFHGRFSVPVPDDLPLGNYQLGFVLLGADGRVLPATAAGEDARIPKTPVYAVGEARLLHAVQIVSREEMNRLALADLAASFQLASRRACEEAEEAWERALRHRTRSGDWRRANRPLVARAIAICWAQRAALRDQRADALLERVRELERARDWDPTAREVWTQAVGIASEAHARAISTDDLASRFLWAEAAVHADPRRSADRSLAESARRGWLSVSRSPEDEGGERDD